MSRVVVVAGWANSLLTFRSELLASLVAAGHEVVAMAPGGNDDITARLERLNVRFSPIPLHRTGLNPFSEIRTYLALRKTLRDHRPDVALAYTIKAIIWTGFALRGLKGPRFYAMVTGLGFALQGGGMRRTLLSGVTKLLYRGALGGAVRVIFQNRDNRATFIENRLVDPAKTSVVNGSGVDLERFALAPLPREGLVFLSIGRILGEKGFRIYAEAARIVRRSHPGAVFRLLGPFQTSPDAIPAAEVRAWQAEGLIEYHEATRDVRPAIAACHVFVLPSYHEGMPRTVLEAMAMGRPILTTDVPGCRETVVAGENGFLVPKADAQALAERLLWFAEHRDAWPRMALKSRQMAEQRFDVREVNRELLAILGLDGGSQGGAVS